MRPNHKFKISVTKEVVDVIQKNRIYCISLNDVEISERTILRLGYERSYINYLNIEHGYCINHNNVRLSRVNGISVLRDFFNDNQELFEKIGDYFNQNIRRVLKPKKFQQSSVVIDRYNEVESFDVAYLKEYDGYFRGESLYKLTFKLSDDNKHFIVDFTGITTIEKIDERVFDIELTKSEKELIENKVEYFYSEGSRSFANNTKYMDCILEKGDRKLITSVRDKINKQIKSKFKENNYFHSFLCELNNIDKNANLDEGEIELTTNVPSFTGICPSGNSGYWTTDFGYKSLIFNGNTLKVVCRYVYKICIPTEKLTIPKMSIVDEKIKKIKDLESLCDRLQKNLQKKKREIEKKKEEIEILSEEVFN